MKRDKIYRKTGGRCAYCGKKLSGRWHRDHIVPIKKGGKDTLDNLVASCVRCNLWKDVFTVEQFRKEIGEQIKRLGRDSSPFNLVLDYDLIEINETKVEFYFERMEK